MRLHSDPQEHCRKARCQAAYDDIDAAKKRRKSGILVREVEGLDLLRDLLIGHGTRYHDHGFAGATGRLPVSPITKQVMTSSSCSDWDASSWLVAAASSAVLAGRVGWLLARSNNRHSSRILY